MGPFGMRGSVVPGLAMGILLVCTTEASGDMASLGAVIERLRTLPVVEDYSYGTVPPEAKPLLRELKHGLRDLALDVVTSEYSHSPTPKMLENAIVSRLKKMGVTVGETPDPQKELGYGYIENLDVQVPAGHKNLIAVRTVVSVTCGTDGSLYVFQKQGKKWKLILAVESEEYGDVTGAKGSFDYRISPQDNRDEFFVVAVDINPWCTSVWQGIRYAVLRVGPDPYNPLVVGSGTEIINLNEEYKVELIDNRFSLSFLGEGSEDDPAHPLPRTVSFEVRKDRLVPQAMSVPSKPDK